MGCTLSDLARWRSEESFPAELEEVARHLARQYGVPKLIEAAQDRALNMNSSGDEQRKWMLVFLKLVSSPLGKTTTFTE